MRITKDLKYYKKNAEKEYSKVPLNVLKYIMYLEVKYENLKQTNV